MSPARRVCLCASLFISFLGAQTAPPPSIQHIYVGKFAGSDSNRLRPLLIKELQRSKQFEIVSSPAEADAILAGTVDVYVSGYYSLFARAGTSARNGRPIYSGYATVDLKDRSGQPLWSYLANLGAGSSQPVRKLSREIARHLAQALRPAAAKAAAPASRT